MRQTIRWLAVLVLPVLLLTAPLVGAPKEKDKDKDTNANTDKTIKTGTLMGKVSLINEGTRTITLDVTISYSVPDVGQMNNLAQAQIRLAQAQASRDFNGMAQARLDMARAQLSLYRMETKTQAVKVQPIEDVVVRTARPKDDFDEKGKVKKLTKAELKELKGDPKLPGYKAEFGDLSTGQMVQVTLVRKKGAGAPKIVAPKKGKKGAEGEGALDLGDNLPLVSVILIMPEPPMPRTK